MGTGEIPEEHVRAEALAAAVPGVLEAAVSPGEDEDGQEGLEVFVVVPGPAARLEAAAQVRRALARGSCPAVVRVHFPPALPRSPRGDLDRARLADPGRRASPEGVPRFPTGGPGAQVPGTPGTPPGPLPR
ncbi:hypothetical protein [Nocardiopsis flavescens]